MHLFGRPLAEIFRDRIMQPVGATEGWSWAGYDSSLPVSSCFAIGAGASFTWIEPERSMVLVVRWIDADHADSFFGRVLQALDDPG